MGTTIYNKDDWDNGATTNSKVTRTMGSWEQWDTATYSERLKQLHCLQVHQSNRYIASIKWLCNWTIPQTVTLTIIDYGCSRGVVFLPCSTTITGPRIAQLYLDNVYWWFGLPIKVITDRDPRFTSVTALLGHSTGSWVSGVSGRSVCSVAWYRPSTRHGCTLCVKRVWNKWKKLRGAWAVLRVKG